MVSNFNADLSRDILLRFYRILGNDFHIFLFAAVPSSPQNLTVSRVTNRSLTVEWFGPSYPNGNISGYR